MDDIVELVELPDVAAQPLVHPLDLAVSRGRFRSGWLVGVLSAPAVGLLVGVIAWRLGAGYVIPVIAGVSLVLIGSFARDHLIEESWAYIPRRRQDRLRALPPLSELAAGAVSGGAIVIAAKLAAPALIRTDIPIGVSEFVLGAAGAVAVLVALDVASSLTLHRGSYVGRPWYALPIAIGVVLAVVVGRDVLATAGASMLSIDAPMGAAMMFAAGAAVAVWRGLRARRDHGSARSVARA